ncbi:MAG: NAD-dependent epimerase/dehydratase family protein [Thermoleophilaceae bacterium]
MEGNGATQPAVLVTGAAGFIGSHLCERLLRDGHVVHGLDSYTNHYSRRLKELNLAALRKHPQFHFHLRDLVGAPLDELVREVSVVYHLAARPGVRDSWEVFDDYAHSNMLGAKNLLDACAVTGARYVYASSSSVYGNSPVLPVVEQLALRPISPYGVTKVMAEVMAGSYMEAHGFDVVGLRYFTVYGPRQRPDMALERFIDWGATGQPIRIYGDGRQMRDFTYVDDIVDGTVLAARYGVPGEVYNLASSNPQPLVDVLELVGELLGRELDLQFVDAQIGDVRDTWGDMSKAARTFGYEPRVSLREGIAAQIEEAARRREVAPEPEVRIA